MSLYCHRLGHGPDLVLLHGWGLQGDIFGDVAARLARHWRVTVVDLPGHGRSPAPAEAFTLSQTAAALAEAVPETAHWLGWSLGGLIALQHARAHPHRVSTLTLVASTPRYTAAPDWPHALTAAALREFTAGLSVDYAGTLERFLSLQVRPADPHGRRPCLRRLRQQARRFPPSLQVLNEGLDLLCQTDLRPVLPALPCPALMLLGERDPLVPAAVGADLQRLNPSLQVCVMAGAGHAPFLSHPDAFVAHVEDFLHRHG